MVRDPFNISIWRGGTTGAMRKQIQPQIDLIAWEQAPLPGSRRHILRDSDEKMRPMSRKTWIRCPLLCQTRDSPDDISPAQIENEALWQWPDPTPGVAATRPWQMQVTWPRQIFVRRCQRGNSPCPGRSAPSGSAACSPFQSLAPAKTASPTTNPGVR
jgi:hypothetical protein